MESIENIPKEFIVNNLTENQKFVIEMRYNAIKEFTERKKYEYSVNIIADLARYYNISMSNIYNIVYNKKYRVKIDEN